MSEERFLRCITKYKINKEISPDDYAQQLTKNETLKLANEIVSDMSVESKDNFIIDYFMWCWKATRDIDALNNSLLPIKGM